ncbi:MAG: TRAP transporter small permease [Bacteroidetes bacterium]|nr:TRAP transporter small permease [Bacteroidota bacterium]
MKEVLFGLDRVISILEKGFIALCLLAGALLLFVNVLMRYIFLAPISWAEEVTLYLCVWLVFVGGSVAVREKGHIAIDLLPHILSPQGRVLLARLVALLCLVFLLVFCWYSLQHVVRVKSIGQVTPIMQAPMWLTYLAMPVGSLLMALRVVQVFFGNTRDKNILEGPNAATMRD